MTVSNHLRYPTTAPLYHSQAKHFSKAVRVCDIVPLTYSSNRIYIHLKAHAWQCLFQIRAFEWKLLRLTSARPIVSVQAEPLVALVVVTLAGMRAFMTVVTTR